MVGREGGGERRLEGAEVRAGGRVALVAAFGAVWFIWGSTYLAIAWAVEGIPPLLMIGVRCLLAGTVLYAWGAARGSVRPSPADWGDAARAGILMFVTGQAVLAWAETRVPSGAASLLIATEPLFITLLAWRQASSRGVIGGAPRPAQALALLVGLVGVAVLVLPGVGGAGLDLVGAGAAVAASFSWSMGVVRGSGRPGIPAGQTAGMQLLAASAVLLVLAVGAGDLGALPPGGPSPRALAAFAYLVVLGSVVTFGAYVWLLGRVGPARLSTHAYVNPLVAVALGAVLNGEAVTAGLVGGATLILGSVVVLLRAPAHAPPEVVADAVAADVRLTVPEARLPEAVTG
ncbi:MAG: hypothetical protein AMXMBFR53_02330 [Gemmatimonadota bacterium]